MTEAQTKDSGNADEEEVTSRKKNQGKLPGGRENGSRF